MKKIRSIAALTASIACVTSVVPFAAFAADTDYVYGTMNIPYADFYQAELADSSNAYEVDAVSSATNTKWVKNGEGELFEGSYHSEANADGSGTILGVTYPVAITQADLDSLSDNYGFTALTEKPEAYKTVTVTNGKPAFSAVVDDNAETFTATVNLSTETPWGDYVISVDSAPETLGAIYGAVLKTKEGHAYAMRHEQNIWRGQFAWSSGIKTSEPHGNTLDYENFESLMGETINEIVYIAKSGYFTVSTDTYVPVKFNNELSVEDGKAGTGSVSWSNAGFPSDYQGEYTVADNFTVSTSGISYTNAKAGIYTLTATDASGKYAGFSTSFTLSTADLPVAYEDGKLVAADGFTADDAANFIKNLNTVNVNGTDYSASGRGAVAIVGEDGTIDFDVKTGRGDTATSIFDGSGNYTITFTATGYETPLTVTTGNTQGIVFGTMDIPYNEFYKAEIENTPYEIDAVSSATTSKWNKNGEGELFEGTFNQGNDDGTGTILGVTYPVAVSAEDVASIPAAYNFTALSEVPAAYKNVTVTGGNVEFSAVVDDSTETLDTTVTLLTDSKYGDYQVNPASFPANTAVYGVVINTKEGNSYALRHEQNIWRNGQVSWSAGFKTTESHGNTLDVENYDELSGQTITSIQYITKDGYLTLSTDTYVPIKFNNKLGVEDGISGTGSVAWIADGFPNDYNPDFSIADNFTVSTGDATISYQSAQPGVYTLTISDKNSKYADVSTSFTLSTADMPVTYDVENGKLVAAEGFTEADAANFIKNLTTVTVNDKNYSTSGKGAVKIVGEDGTIDFDAKSGNGDSATAVFDGTGNYKITFTATGYDKSLIVTLSGEEEDNSGNDSGSGSSGSGNTSTTKAASTTAAKSTTTTTASAAKTNVTDSNPSPKTGEGNTAAGILAALSAAGLTAFLSKKRKRK